MATKEIKGPGDGDPVEDVVDEVEGAVDIEELDELGDEEDDDDDEKTQTIDDKILDTLKAIQQVADPANPGISLDNAPLATSNEMSPKSDFRYKAPDPSELTDPDEPEPLNAPKPRRTRRVIILRSGTPATAPSQSPEASQPSEGKPPPPPETPRRGFLGNPEEEMAVIDHLIKNIPDDAKKQAADVIRHGGELTIDFKHLYAINCRAARAMNWELKLDEGAKTLYFVLPVEPYLANYEEQFSNIYTKLKADPPKNPAHLAAIQKLAGPGCTLDENGLPDLESIFGGAVKRLVAGGRRALDTVSSLKGGGEFHKINNKGSLVFINAGSRESDSPDYSKYVIVSDSKLIQFPRLAPGEKGKTNITEEDREEFANFIEGKSETLDLPQSVVLALMGELGSKMGRTLNMDSDCKTIISVYAESFLTSFCGDWEKALSDEDKQKYPWEAIEAQLVATKGGTLLCDLKKIVRDLERRGKFVDVRDGYAIFQDRCANPKNEISIKVFPEIDEDTLFGAD